MPSQTLTVSETVRLLTVPQACETLNISRMSLYRLMETGDLRRVKIGRSVRIRVEDVLALIERETL
jgi:excisionase family DNA binding protein